MAPSTTSGTSIGIVSGRGGVGKSILAVNLGAVLTKRGDKNIIIDADISNPSIGLHLGLPYSPTGLQDVLLEHKHFRDAILAHPSTGMRVLPSSLKYSRGASLRNLARVVNEVGKAYDFTIVDSPPGITDDVMHILDACDEIVVVTTPDVPGVSSATKIIQLCKENKKRVRGVVVNRCTGAPFELTVREIESMTESSVIVRIPEDRTIPASISMRVPAVYYAPDSPASRKLNEFALSLIQAGPRETERAGVMSRFFAWLRKIFS
ncbi:Iron-sulfur cluster carrier protein [Candidatus Norongarragalina meridionalis]|nr:Iron-sulfur cluster carrier protein [Candidatus Norongarragalina meridionalis]